MEHSSRDKLCKHPLVLKPEDKVREEGPGEYQLLRARYISGPTSDVRYTLAEKLPSLASVIEQRPGGEEVGRVRIS